MRRPDLLRTLAVTAALSGVSLGLGMGGSGRPDFGGGTYSAAPPAPPTPPRRDHGEKERSLAERKTRRARRKQRGKR